MRYQASTWTGSRLSRVGQRQPDGADLMPARREAVEDPPRDDEVRLARRSG